MLRVSLMVASLLFCSTSVMAAQAHEPAGAPTQQAPPQTAPVDPHAQHNMAAMGGGWMFMVDGVVFATYNKQDKPRGATEFKSQNWLMLMAQHKLGPGEVTLKGMFSAEPLTLTDRGYSQLFQHGEAYNGLENIDYQHPHDMFMQLAVSWRVKFSEAVALTLSGGPMGEATLGPAAFMHRQSASENPTAPISHHTFDSTHIAQGVVAARLDLGKFAVEGSAFHGRESDQYRYGVTPGRLDSWAARLWFRPSSSLLAQVSHGFINEGEELEPGDQKRTTASVSWARGDDARYLAVTAAGGYTMDSYDNSSRAYLAEATFHRPRGSLYTRVEHLQVATESLSFPFLIHTPHPFETIDWLTSATIGGVLNVNTRGPFEIGIGADATFYDVPANLRSSPQTTMYGASPKSFHVFIRVRPRAPSMGHMWNMIMSDSAMR
ncbi:MAG: hypothetical protein IPL75_14285 [Acidobacteria bacterium]|nr:hypothetical protein [Acidobacteriota bacterium]